MSSIFGLWSSYMLEYCWLFALLLRWAKYFPGVEEKWTLLPPMLPPSFAKNYFSSTSVQGFPFLHILANTCLFFFFFCPFDNIHSDRVRWYLIVVLICTSLILVMLTIFSNACRPSVCLFWKKNSIQILCQFLNWIGWFLLLSCISPLYILDVNPTLYIEIVNIFSHSVDCLFIFSCYW